MKKLLIVLIVLIAFSGIAYAQGTKVGVVNPDRVVSESAKGKAFFATHDAFVKTKQAEIDVLVKQFQKKQKDAQDNAAAMTEDQRRQISSELERMQTDLKRKQEDAQREVQLRLNSKLEEMQKEIGPLVRQVAIEKGLNLVLLNNPSTGVFYADATVDITPDVIAKYNAAQ